MGEDGWRMTILTWAVMPPEGGIQAAGAWQIIRKVLGPILVRAFHALHGRDCMQDMHAVSQKACGKALTILVRNQLGKGEDIYSLVLHPACNSRDRGTLIDNTASESICMICVHLRACGQ